MTYWCPICSGHKDEDHYPGENFGSMFFPDGVLVCDVCMERHKDNKWFNHDLIKFEKDASPYLYRVLEQLTNEREGQNEEKLEYGDNVCSIFEENKKFHDELTRLEMTKFNFGKSSSDWAETLYRIAWRQDERYIGEKVSWFSRSNSKIIQARIVSIDEGGQQYKLRALETEDYKVKDKNGVLQKGSDKIVTLHNLYPPVTLGKDIYKKQKVCHGCCRMHLKGSFRRGLDYENEHWFCSGCNIMSFGDLSSHEVQAYHEHFGKPMEEIPEHHREKFIKHNTDIMKKQRWPCTQKKPWPNPLPYKRVVKKFGDNQEENDLRFTGDIKFLTKCNGCGLKVSEGWADSRVDPNDWNCKWCWNQYNLREGCPTKPTVIPHRLGVIILPSDEITSMDGFEYLWKITKLVDKVSQQKIRKKGKKMNLQTFHQNY